MSQIKHIVFDLGGVIIHLDHSCAVRRFESIGISNAAALLNPYEQKGIFLDFENGKLDMPSFCRELSKYAGRELTKAEVVNAWKGFIVEVPQYKLDYISELRKTHRVSLLSNTNPAIMEWARSTDFSEVGLPITSFFDAIYTSYEIGITKPDRRIFEYMLKRNVFLSSETLFVDDGEKNVKTGESLGMFIYKPENGEDWRDKITNLL
ncbi:MAG: HAD family phosphatase [Tannerellaceae bacterium]|jgi:putative hydrolase of the HAD superfamily|nr:HAD family phosphatase [Tannerellaceae bacterium]